MTSKSLHPFFACWLMPLTLVGPFLVGSGCAPKPPSAPMQAPQQSNVFHTVQYSGETLAAIAKWYTGASSNWEAIRDANPSIDPRKLRKGMSLQIPQSLVVRTDPFPKPKTGVVATRDTMKAPDQPGTLSESSQPASQTPEQFAATDETTITATTTSVALTGSDLPQPPAADSPQYDGSSASTADDALPVDSQGNDMAMPSSAPDAGFGDAGSAAYTGEQEVTPPQTESKQGLMKGILEAVGNAALDAKKQPAPEESR